MHRMAYVRAFVKALAWIVRISACRMDLHAIDVSRLVMHHYLEVNVKVIMEDVPQIHYVEHVDILVNIVNQRQVFNMNVLMV